MIARIEKCCTENLNSATNNSEVANADTIPRMRLGRSLININIHPTSAITVTALAKSTINDNTPVRKDRKSNLAPCALVYLHYYAYRYTRTYEYILTIIYYLVK